MTEAAQPLDGRTCLVTGGAGYLGQHIAEALLARGCTVHVLDLLPCPRRRPGLVWFQGNLLSEADLEAACEGVDTLFHTAAMIEPLTYTPRVFAERVREVNVEGTRKLLEVAARRGVKRFVHTSSIITAYGQDCVGGDERGPYSTRTDLYSSTKVDAERLVLAANDPGTMLSCAIRPGGIYGPGERALLVGPLVRVIKKGVPIIMFGNERSLMDYSYVDNLVDAQLRAAERLYEGSPVCGQAYFITDGSPMNTGEFSRQLVANMGIESRHDPGSSAGGAHLGARLRAKLSGLRQAQAPVQPRERRPMRSGLLLLHSQSPEGPGLWSLGDLGGGPSTHRSRGSRVFRQPVTTPRAVPIDNAVRVMRQRGCKILFPGLS